MLIRVGSAVAFGVWAMGCSDSSSAVDPGELLLSISGEAQIDEREASGLGVALGFRADGHAIEIVDVPMHGAFPADFRVDIYEPPPTAALAKVSRQAGGEPRVALAYLTAVDSDHNAIYVADEVRVTAFGCKNVGRADNLCLETRSEWCLVGKTDVPCYVENAFCPAGWTSKEQCIIESHGDRALAAGDIGEYFAGFSSSVTSS